MKEKIKRVIEIAGECIAPGIIILTFIVVPLIFCWEIIIRLAVGILILGAIATIYYLGPTLVATLKEKFMKLGEFTRWMIGATCVSVIIGVLLIAGQVHRPIEEARSIASTSHVVYKTVTGKCYHRKGCGYLRTCIETTEAKAIRDGLYPCSRCNP